MKGFSTVGIDLDKRKADSLASGKNYIQDIRDEDVASVIKNGIFRAQSDYSGSGELDVIYICVPTPFTDNKEPDISFIKSAAESIAKNLRNGQLIILKSTTYPNTTEGLVLPILEATGKKVGKDFFLRSVPSVLIRAIRNFQRQIRRSLSAAYHLIAQGLQCLQMSRSSQKSFLSAVRKLRRWKSCWKIFFARSILHSLMSLQNSATAWAASICGKSSKRRQQSLSASCRSIPDRGSAGIAF